MTTGEPKRVLCLLGPTASGKSSVIDKLFAQAPGVFTAINCDSKQAFQDLRILTASPTPQEIGTQGLKLYNYVPLDQDFNAHSWARDAARAITKAWSEGKVPILVGGTGFFVKVLVEGISHLPKISESTKLLVAKSLTELGSPAIFERLKELDPRLGTRLLNNDSYRVGRAYAIYIETGQSIIDFHGDKLPILPNAKFEVSALLPDKNVLDSKIDSRFDSMISSGVLTEVRDVFEQFPDRFENPKGIFKAHGLPELVSYLRGITSWKEAISTSKLHTRQYAKRQSTFFRNQFKEAKFFSSMSDIANSLLDTLSTTNT